jgi:hypothetical protein
VLISHRLRLLSVTALSAIVTLVLAVGLPQRQAAAATITPIGQAGEVKQYGTSNCLTNSNSMLSMSSCSGTFGQQLWIAEPDKTIRIWGYGSANNNVWTAATEECLNVPTNAPTTVVLSTCGQLTTGGSNPIPTDTWQINDQGGYATIGNIWQTGQCLTTSFKLAGCDPTKTSQQWVLPAADTLHQAASAALGLQSMYRFSNGLFGDTLNPDCDLQTNQWYKSGTNSLPNVYGGNCWWWSANALYAMIDFLEQAGSWSGSGNLKADIATTYDTICSAGTANCPVTDATKDPSGWVGNISGNLNHFQNNYFDDTGNWALAWLNAYEYTSNKNYLYLAENLWHFITANSWGYVPNGETNSCGTGGLVQFRHWTESYTTYPAKNLGTNALYLRLSSWLYVITGDNTYFDGVGDSSGGNDGGLQLEAKWLMNSSGLVQLYQNDAGQTLQPDQPGARYMLDGEVDPNTACSIARGNAKETQHEGMVLAGLASTHDAIVKAGKSSTPPSSLGQMEQAPAYLTMADNLAETAINDDGSPGHSYTSPLMIDGNKVLSETCTSETGQWPDGCDINPSEAPDGDEPETIDPAWLPGKGIFIRGLYCVNSALLASTVPGPDTALSPFITSSATQVWNNDQNAGQFASNLDQFGFLWDYDLYHANWSEAGQGYATEGSALEALTASFGIGVSSPAMC